MCVLATPIRVSLLSCMSLSRLRPSPTARQTSFAVSKSTQSPPSSSSSDYEVKDRRFLWTVVLVHIVVGVVLVFFLCTTTVTTINTTVPIKEGESTLKTSVLERDEFFITWVMSDTILSTTRVPDITILSTTLLLFSARNGIATCSLAEGILEFVIHDEDKLTNLETVQPLPEMWRPVTTYYFVANLTILDYHKSIEGNVSAQGEIHLNMEHLFNPLSPTAIRIQLHPMRWKMSPSSTLTV